MSRDKRKTGEGGMKGWRTRRRNGSDSPKKLAAEIERLREREAQAKTIILAAAVYVGHCGGWQETWHRDADKWIALERRHA